ncbi:MULTISPECIES: polysaccharide deacetylase family protein [Bacillus cereus group]|uniref:Polysaccharide deacetylase n=1 Tax=Bacillus cereus TaxID=1396 RepID=A0AA44Q6T8_BACCE|nr:MULTISPECIES: polysaccharide deacetylase family protein [Bacillus cereus group]EEL52357.1 Polysaccharide deacetylase [Bacillus cereus Rock3-44]PFA17404.1 polysaccharide deacetylase [Bacillus cereus]PFN06793.1 polysaccharide deacetylase [Bacillus cereus]PFR27300.1 polysaccharide deacetylase [Bacillus cereus]PFR92085.1 polysaccharide deacetylase [Bacillus cereus]
MKKYAAIALCTSAILAGCNSSNASNEPKKEKTVQEQSKKTIEQVQPQGKIYWNPITHESTNTSIHVTDLKDSFAEVQYKIWRTADGKGNAKLFTSKEKDKQFIIAFDIKEFEGKRGEYQIESAGVKEDGKIIPLTTSSIVFEQHAPILMYHAIEDYYGAGIKDLFVSPANFEAQMRYLKENGYTLLTFERWSDINKVNKPIFVTFDDGMKNNMNAFHILQKLKDDKFKPTATEYMIVDNIDAEGSLSTADIKEMIDSGIFSVQSHTATHADLPKITNYEDELKGSKERLEKVTGKPVIAVAYPFGHVNDKVIEETKKYYQFATTTKSGQFITKGEPNELFKMKRVRIHHSTTVEQFSLSIK